MSYQTETDEELTEEEVNELMGLAETREDIVNSVFSDYQKVKKEMIDEGYNWKQAKYPDTSVEQSFTNHIDNGVNFILNLYSSLPENHFMVEEEFLREVVYLYVCHDYHKLRESGYSDEFDISLEEVEDFVEEISLKELHDEPNVEAIRGFIMSHHVTDDRSCDITIPHEYIDEFNFVLLADAMASTESLDDIKSDNSNVRKRFDKANHLDYNLSLGYHIVDRNPDEMTKLFNKSVSEVLNERGYNTLKLYENGCLYVIEEEVEEDIVDEIYETFIDKFKISNHKYSLRASESTNTELSSQNQRYYKQRCEDVLFKGLETVLRGVIKRAIEHSREGDYEATDKMKSKVNDIEKFIDIDILTKNRRVEYLASSIHSIRMYFVEEMDFYEKDALGFLELFNIHTEEREEQIKELIDNEDKIIMSSGTRKWYYKYVIAQYIYEDHFNGEAGRELAEKISKMLVENMGDKFEKCENRIIGGIESEIKDYIARNVTIDGKKVGEMSNNIHTENAYNKCEYCGYQTSADCDRNGLKLSSDDTTQDFEMETNVTGSGEIESINPSNEPNICYVCQLETLMRQTTREGLDEEGRVFVEMMGDYGFVPQEEWVFGNILDNQKFGHNLSINNGMSKKIVENEIPECVIKSMRCGDNESFISQERGMSVSSSFGRGRISLPVNIEDTINLYESVAVVAVACAYSGVRAHISTNPVSRVDYSENEVLVIDEEISEEISFFEPSNSLKEVKNIVQSICTLEVYSKNFGSRYDDIRVIEKISKNFAAPASRLSRMCNETIEVSQKHIIMADKEFTQKERYSELITLASTVSSLLPEKTRKETKNVIAGCLRPYRNDEVDNSTWIINELVKYSSLPEGASEALAEEAAEKIESYFEGVEESERLNKMGEEIIDTVIAYKRG